MMSTKTKKVQTNINTPRHSARVAAVQALYQVEQTKESTKHVVRDMSESEFSILQQEGYVRPENELFENLVHNTFLLKGEIDIIIKEFLSDNWRLDRLSCILKIILRLATYELRSSLTIPSKIILNEYIEITKDFLDNKSEVGFVNGILDKISKHVRDEE